MMNSKNTSKNNNCNTHSNENEDKVEQNIFNFTLPQMSQWDHQTLDSDFLEHISKLPEAPLDQNDIVESPIRESTPRGKLNATFKKKILQPS